MNPQLGKIVVKAGQKVTVVHYVENEIFGWIREMLREQQGAIKRKLAKKERKHAKCCSKIHVPLSYNFRDKDCIRSYCSVCHTIFENLNFCSFSIYSNTSHFRELNIDFRPFIVKSYSLLP